MVVPDGGRSYSWIWAIVGVLLVIALIIFIVQRVNLG